MKGKVVDGSSSPKGKAKRKTRGRSQRYIGLFGVAFDAARTRSGAHVDDVIGQMKHQGWALANGQKHRVAEQFMNVSGAIRRAAEELGDSDSDALASYVELAADRVEDAARYVDEQDASHVVEHVSMAARRRPLLFAGGLFLAGVAAAQFIRAAQDQLTSRPHRPATADDRD